MSWSDRQRVGAVESATAGQLVYIRAEYVTNARLRCQTQVAAWPPGVVSLGRCATVHLQARIWRQRNVLARRIKLRIISVLAWSSETSKLGNCTSPGNKPTNPAAETQNRAMRAGKECMSFSRTKGVDFGKEVVFLPCGSETTTRQMDPSSRGCCSSAGSSVAQPSEIRRRPSHFLTKTENANTPREVSRNSTLAKRQLT